MANMTDAEIAEEIAHFHRDEVMAAYAQYLSRLPAEIRDVLLRLPLDQAYRVKADSELRATPPGTIVAIQGAVLDPRAPSGSKERVVLRTAVLRDVEGWTSPRCLFEMHEDDLEPYKLR